MTAIARARPARAGSCATPKSSKSRWCSSVGAGELVAGRAVVGVDHHRVRARTRASGRPAARRAPTRDPRRSAVGAKRDAAPTPSGGCTSRRCRRCSAAAAASAISASSAARSSKETRRALRGRAGPPLRGSGGDARWRRRAAAGGQNVPATRGSRRSGATSAPASRPSRQRVLHDQHDQLAARVLDAEIAAWAVIELFGGMRTTRATDGDCSSHSAVPSVEPESTATISNAKSARWRAMASTSSRSVAAAVPRQQHDRDERRAHAECGRGRPAADRWPPTRGRPPRSTSPAAGRRATRPARCGSATIERKRPPARPASPHRTAPAFPVLDQIRDAAHPRADHRHAGHETPRESRAASSRARATARPARRTDR